jgi:hypothetical protein
MNLNLNTQYEQDIIEGSTLLGVGWYWGQDITVDRIVLWVGQYWGQDGIL